MDCRDAVMKGMKFIEDNMEENLTLHKIAAVAGYSPYHYERLFRNHSGLSVMEYVKRRRMARAYEAIAGGSKIIDAALANGYGSHSGFTKAFQQNFGFSPVLLKMIQTQVCYFEGGDIMESLLSQLPQVHAGKEQLYEAIIRAMDENGVPYHPQEFENAYLQSCRLYGSMNRYSGDAYVTHPLNVALILALLGAEEDLVMAGLFCDCLERTETRPEALGEFLSQQTVEIIVQAGAIAGHKNIQLSPELEAPILLNLARRLNNMRTLEFMDGKMYAVKAKETIDLYLPLARETGNMAMAEALCKLSQKYLIEN